MNENSNPTLLFCHSSNKRTQAAVKKLERDIELLNFNELFFTDSGLYRADMQLVDFSNYGRVIFFPSLQGPYKFALIKYLKEFYPTTKLRNIPNVPECKWNWENKFDLFLAIRCFGIENINLPKTLAVNYQAEPAQVVKFAGAYLGHYPFVVKPSWGSQGRSVKLVTNEAELLNLLLDAQKTDRLFYLTNMLLIQQMIKPKIQEDLRGIMLKDKVIGGMKRASKKEGEFRNNYSLGGSISKHDVSEPEI